LTPNRRKKTSMSQNHTFAPSLTPERDADPASAWRTEESERRAAYRQQPETVQVQGATLILPIFSTGPTYGDSRQAETAERARAAAHEAQCVRFAIAPRSTVTTPRGVLTAGAEITVEDVAHSLPVLQELVRRGAVLEIPSDVAAARSTPSSARYIVRPDMKGSLLIHGRSGLPGSAAEASDFATPGHPAEPARDSYVDKAGNVCPAVPARVGQLPNDGTAQLAHLIERGHIVDRGEPATATKSKRG
jgi:hypothetical protein